jgi:ribulose-5-phosphate 4-epimerase/fuculose-1-phosphate aldolase
MVGFHRPGQPDLIRGITDELRNAKNAIYLAKHGIVTFAEDLWSACDIAEEFEQNARIYVVTGGKVPLLDPKEVDRLRKME